MNIFGLVIGQHILMLIFGLLLISLGLFLMSLGWIGRIVGLLVFASSVGWTASIILTRDAQSVELGVLVSFLTLAGGAVMLFSDRDKPRRSLPSSKSAQISRNTVIGGVIMVVCVFTAATYVLQGNWESFIQLDDPVAQRAMDQTQNGFLRFANTILQATDDALAR
jgi:hypothetical protein